LERIAEMIGPEFKRTQKDERLRHINVLVADEDERIGKLVYHVLHSFGFREVHIVTSPADAVRVLKKAPIDFVITEWPMQLQDNEDLIHFIRTSEESPKRDVPIIVLTGRAERPDVLRARDSGTTEFVVKPFTAKTLSHRIIQIIDNPRQFVTTTNFVGPDRRRARATGPNAADNRMPAREMEKHAVVVGNDTIYNIHGQKVIISKPNEILKDAIGRDVSAEFLLDEEAVKKAQEVIFEMRHDYMEWVAIDLSRLEFASKELSKRPDDSKQRATLAEVAFAIKSQAGTFGYNLASAVAKQLHDYVQSLRTVDPAALTVIKKHSDTLLVIFHQEIQGTGEKLGEEVLVGLKMLIDKYKSGK